MSLGPGAHVGPYKVIAVIGAGGMGEVYRATDTRLGRDVALKVLPDRYASDADRLARFEREARVLATLNHPHIAAIHGLEDSNGTRALVLELVEGETLADRIARGPIPIDEALVIAQQIADALDAAHERGIIHRDLKPANIKITASGTVKVLDFGLAKLAERSLPAVSTSPTITAPLMTGTGTILGTAGYMSPEQARGLPVDRRADAWAFGCVLYEMLTGRRVFAGTTDAEVIAGVLERTPDLTALRSTTPHAVRRLLRRCLTKDPKDRLRDIGDARLDLQEARLPVEDLPVATRSARHWRWVAAGSLAAAVTSGAIVWRAVRPDPIAPPPVVRFSVPSSRGPNNRGLAISSDGARLAYGSAEGFVIRARDRLDGTVLQGLGTFPAFPFFSPEGEWLAYVDGRVLKKISVVGGAPVAVAEVGPAAVCDWAPEGIVCADGRGVFRVPSDGGTPVRLAVDIAPDEQATHPEILPGGRAILYTVIPTRTILVGSFADASGARLEVLEIETGTRKTLIRGGGRARYVPTSHLLYAAGGTLHAVGFDLGSLTVRGQPVEIAPSSVFAVSDEGTLVYASGASGPGSTLVWVDRQGREESLGTPPRPYTYPRLSPDGTRVALDVAGPPDRDIWMWDLRRKTLERFTVDSAANPLVSWSRDGRRVAFGSDRSGVTNLFLQAANGIGEAERLLVSDRLQMPLSFAPDGRLLFSEAVPGQGRNIQALSVDGTRQVEALIHGPANELNAEVSPDGKWIAYDSNESGQLEVYVRPYPNVNDERWLISRGGGTQPLWSADGPELFYRDFAGAIMVTPVKLFPTFVAQEVTKLLDGSGYQGSGPFGSGRTYDVSLDGSRFLLIKSITTADKAPPSIVVVLNWTEELKRLVPAP